MGRLRTALKHYVGMLPGLAIEIPRSGDGCRLPWRQTGEVDVPKILLLLAFPLSLKFSACQCIKRCLQGLQRYK